MGTPTTPTNAPTLFGGTPRPGSAPCVLSPQDGTLMPKKLAAPALRMAARRRREPVRDPAAGRSLSDAAAHLHDDPGAYKLDSALWDDIRRSVLDEPIMVSIRAMTVSGTGTAQQGPSAAAQVSFTIAPVEAPADRLLVAGCDGSNGTGMLKGFGVGEEGVRNVLTPDQVVNRTTVASGNNAVDGCIGCHTATPDGDGVQFVFGPPSA